MARYYRYFDPATQRFYLVDAENDLGSDPGIGMRRSEDMYSRLPDAELAGYEGYGVAPIGSTPDHSVPKTIVIPTHRPLAGAEENNRGAARIVTIPKAAWKSGQAAQAVPSIVQTPVKGGNDAEALGIQLGLEYPPALIDPDPLSLYNRFPLQVTAVIDWGVGGASFTAECDWNQGTFFSLNASFCRITARLEAIHGIGEAANGLESQDLVLKAAISYGNSNTMSVSSPMRKSVIVGSTWNPLGAGSIAGPFRIPSWSYGFTVISGRDAPPNVITRLLSGSGPGGSAVASYQTISNSNTSYQVEGQFPVVSGARFFEVQNLMALNIPLTVIFNLGA